MLSLVLRVGDGLVLASIRDVSDDLEVHPQLESFRACVNTITILGCLAKGMRIAETLFFGYRRMHGTELFHVNLFEGAINMIVMGHL